MSQLDKNVMRVTVELPLYIMHVCSYAISHFNVFS